MPRVTERVIHLDIMVPGRVWCKATDLRDEGEAIQQADLIGNIIVEAEKQKLDRASLAERIALLDFVNAVEIRAGSMDILIYPDWP